MFNARGGVDSVDGEWEEGVLEWRGRRRRVWGCVGAAGGRGTGWERERGEDDEGGKFWKEGEDGGGDEEEGFSAEWVSVPPCF